MPMNNAPRNGLATGWTPGEEQWGGPMNLNLRQLDMNLNMYVQSSSWTYPPPDAEEGYTYIVGSGASGAWSGMDGKIAYLYQSGWEFFSPVAGMRAYLRSRDKHVWFNGADWLDIATGDSVIDPTPPQKASQAAIAATISYEPDPNELLVGFVVPKAMMLQAGAVGSFFSMMDKGAAGDATFLIKRNNVAVGAIAITAGAFSGTFTLVNAVTFAIGDRLQIYAPAATIPGLKDFGITLLLSLLEES